MVVETEPEWDDEERTRMRALIAYERGICACGFHSSITADKSNYFTIEEQRCPVCARSAQYGRVQDAADESAMKSAGENVPAGSPRPADGRSTYLRRMTPDEVNKQRDQHLKRGTGGH